MVDVTIIDPTTVALWEYQGRGEVGEWSREEIENVVRRVNNGAMLLDEKKPRWNFDVVPEKLVMSNSQLCIVGQAYGDYDEFVGPVFGKDEFDDAIDEAMEHGFMVVDEEWPLLDRVWVYLLDERSTTGSANTLQLPPPEPWNIRMTRLKEAGLLNAGSE